MSNVVGSSSAWDGMLSQICSHHGVRYHIERVGLLFYPRWLSLTCNELKDFGNGSEAIETESRRTLRTTSLLAGNPRTVVTSTPEGSIQERVSGVDYVISFRIEAPEKKYEEMFVRRAKSGRYWGDQCYLGMREYPASVELVDDLRALSYPTDMTLVEHANGLKTADYNTQLGLSFYGTDWADPNHPAFFFTPLEVRKGVVEYPSWDSVRRHGVRRVMP